MQAILRPISAILGIILVLVGFSTSPVLLSGCANPARPMGGPRDSIAPVLQSMSPINGTVAFNATKVEMLFDEYIELANVFEEVIINPPIEKFPNIEARLRTLSISFRDSLLPNTTYSIQFGKAVKDVNEGNVYKDLVYAFSTGKALDSMTITGSLISAETGLPDSTLVIMLHSLGADDSTVAKEKPRYATRTNGQGLFKFSYLPKEQFRIYALKDEGFRQYTSPQTPFAFSDTLAAASLSPNPIVLRWFVAEPEPEGEQKTTNTSGNIANNQRRKAAADGAKKLGYSLATQGGNQDILKPLNLNFDKPIDTFFTNKIVLTDTFNNPIALGNITLDTNRTSLQLPVNWQPGTPYMLILQAGFATDTLGATTTKADTLKFTTRSNDDYGEVNLKFTNLDITQKPILLWLQNNKLVQTSKLTGTNIRIPKMEPGTYTLRVVYDVNENGIWDTGNYWQHIQPEFVIPITKEVKITANWQNDFDIEL